MRRFRFNKGQRLVSNEQFRAVLSQRLCASDELLTVYAGRNDCQRARLGVSVGKYCGNAVVRNRLKRRLREAFRANQEGIGGGYDYLVMMSRRPLKGKSRQQVSERMWRLRLAQVERSFLALVSALAVKADKRYGG